MTLKVVEPIEVTEAVLAASDIPEPDTSQGEVEFIPNRRKVETYDKNPAQPNSNFRSVAYVSGQGYYVLTNSDIEHYDEDFNFVTSRGVDSPLGTRERLFSSYDPDTGLSSGVYVLYRDSGNLVYTLASYQYDLSTYTSTVTIDPNAGNLNAKEFCGSIAGGPETFTFAMRDQLPNPPNTPMTFYEFKYEFSTTGPVKEVVGPQSIWDYTYRYNMAYTDKGVALMGFADTNPGQDFITDIFFLTANYTVSDRLTLSLKTELRSNKFVWNGVDYQMWTTSTGFGAPVGDFVVESYDINGFTRGAYQPGDRVIKTSTHQVYQCLTATSQDPEEGATEDSAATWIVVGPTNKWSMFDNLQNTKTINDTDFTVTLNPITYVNTLAVLGFSGVSSVRVEVDDSGGTTIYDKTFTASDFSAIYDHYTYVFYQIVALKKLIVEDLPPLPNTTIRVTFSGSDMQIGELAFGFAVNIGTLVANGTKSDRFRYREQQYNEFGYPTGAAPIVVELNTYDVLVPKLTNPSIQKLLDGLTGKNTLWVGDIGSDQRMITYGFFERSPIPFNMPNDINYQITVRASV